MAEFDEMPQGQMTQAEAHYLPKAPAPQSQCGMCERFLPPNACALVKGEIAPEGTCDLFQPLAEAPGETGGVPPQDEAAMMAQLFGG